MTFLGSNLGVTLQLLWVEYKEQHPDGYQCSQFCDLYHRWARKLQYGLRQEHRAGEKVFVDFSDQRIPVINPKSGEVTRHSLFGAVWGATIRKLLRIGGKGKVKFDRGERDATDDLQTKVTIILIFCLI